MHSYSYLNTSTSIISSYDGKLPLSPYLKQFFSQHKKYGSKDRRYISHLCYCYYRLGQALKDMDVADRIKAALYLCEEEPKMWIDLFEDDWKDNWHKDLKERIDFLSNKIPSFDGQDVFPFTDELSDRVEAHLFILSHFIQPDVFLRIRPNKKEIVVRKLNDNHIGYKELSASCIALPNGSKIDSIIELNKESVVQDYSSQRIAEFLSGLSFNSSKINVWDCCAASGGKSMLTFDTLQKPFNLIVSDIRSSILHNLKQRFHQAGISQYHSFLADLSDSNFQPIKTGFDLIICDVPCSGSGTWSRTPEQLFFFQKESIATYAALQKKIANNALKSLNKEGYFLYITCSVFKQENENMVDYILQNTSFQLFKQEVLIGYNVKADSMFAALFKKID